MKKTIGVTNNISNIMKIILKYRDIPGTDMSLKGDIGPGDYVLVHDLTLRHTPRLNYKSSTWYVTTCSLLHIERNSASPICFCKLGVSLCSVRARRRHFLKAHNHFMAV